ncbi:MAG: hydrogenase small subunit [Coriobacteriia bacterium]|nr:hydrogenase small subunit [Coriobacteriia bacterium]
MTNKGTSFYERLEARGVSRRDFLKFCGSTAAMLGLSSSAAPMIGAKLAGAADSGLYPTMWLHGGACTGCSESVAQATYPNVADIVLDILNLVAQETIQMSTGEFAEENIEHMVEEEKGRYILIVEGTVMTGLGGNTLRIADMPFTEHLDHTAKYAAVVIALGACAVDGGWVVAHPNPAKGTGVSGYLKSVGIDVPVINMPGCPMNPEELVSVVVKTLLLADKDANGVPNLTPIVNALDSEGRPKWLFGSTIHDNCPRRGHFENSNFVYQFGTPEEAKGYCLYPMGCKGPQTFRRCPMLRWNNSVSWCVEAGGPCIGCANWNWVDQSAPFAGRFRRVGQGVLGAGGIDPAVGAAAVGGVVAGVLVAHGFGMKAAKRIGKNATLQNEPMKEYDAKRLKKSGGAA